MTDFILARLREPSTYAGLATFFGGAATQTSGTVQIVLGAIAAGCAAVAIGKGEVPKA